MPLSLNCAHLDNTCQCPRVKGSLFCKHHTCPKCNTGDKSSSGKCCLKCKAGGNKGKNALEGRNLQNLSEAEQLQVLYDAGKIQKKEFDDRMYHVKEEQNKIHRRKGAPPTSTAQVSGKCTAIAKASKHESVFKYEFHYRAKKWNKMMMLVVIDPDPFEQGAMRAAYHMTDLGRREHENQYVAKLSLDEDEEIETYFVDAEMQSMCQYFAAEFNSRGPPKQVHFVEAFLIERFTKDKSPVMACEPYLEGEYVKYSNNYGYVSPDDRNTPQAFSHFTHWHSNGKFIVVDVQGVADKYTDPQVHSKDGEGFGKGNVGQEGIDEFFSSHKCNAICKQLGLTDKIEDFKGTMVQAYVPTDLNYTNEPTEEDLAYFGIDMANYKKIREEFKKADSDGSGEISMKELPSLCRALKLEVSAKELLRAMTEHDADGSGEMSLVEFLSWWTGQEPLRK